MTSYSCKVNLKVAIKESKKIMFIFIIYVYKLSLKILNCGFIIAKMCIVRADTNTV